MSMSAGSLRVPLRFPPWGFSTEGSEAAPEVSGAARHSVIQGQLTLAGHQVRVPSRSPVPSSLVWATEPSISPARWQKVNPSSGGHADRAIRAPARPMRTRFRLVDLVVLSRETSRGESCHAARKRSGVVGAPRCLRAGRP
jgi:hypothetical protein